MTPLPDNPKVIVLLMPSGEKRVVSNISTNIEVVVMNHPEKFNEQAVGMIVQNTPEATDGDLNDWNKSV